MSDTATHDPRAGLLELVWGDKPDILEAWKADHDCNERTFVYFIRAAGGPIKIGTAREPHRRISSIQVCHPDELALLASWAGCSHVEGALHDHFRRHHVRGEWFKPSAELLGLIGAVQLAQAELWWQDRR